MPEDESYAAAIDEHYRRRWGAPIDSLRLDRGPVHELPAQFRVLVFQRSSETVAYATRCMSQSSDDVPLELHLLCQAIAADSSPLVELLTAIAHYHRTGARLGLGHTVNFGKPWLEGSECTHGLISLPYLDGTALEWCHAPRIRFLWLVPVTKAEVEFKKTHGVEALEQQFDDTQPDLMNPWRQGTTLT